MSNATQQYREVQRKANAGERIKIVNAGYAGNPPVYANGDVLIAGESGYGYAVRVNRNWNNGCAAFVSDNEYVVLEPVVAPAPVSANLPDLFAQFIRDNACAVRSYLAEIDPVDSVDVFEIKTPLTRAKVIEMARERVAELERIGRDDDARLEGSAKFRGAWFEIDFVVNRDKRAVTALVYELSGFSYARKRNKPNAVGIAKAAPDDVFNADIGKAIAAERALGLTLTPEFVNAPKPAEPAVGMIVGLYDNEAEYLRLTVSGVSREKLRGTVDGTSGFVYRDAARRHGGNCTDPVIIDDTNAVYTQATFDPCEAV